MGKPSYQLSCHTTIKYGVYGRYMVIGLDIRPTQPHRFSLLPFFLGARPVCRAFPQSRADSAVYVAYPCYNHHNTLGACSNVEMEKFPDGLSVVALCIHIWTDAGDGCRRQRGGEIALARAAVFGER